MEKDTYKQYDKLMKPLPKIKDINGKETIDIQKVREISKRNEIAAFRQAFIAGVIELRKEEYETSHLTRIEQSF